jgi:hypothetical protein
MPSESRRSLSSITHDLAELTFSVTVMLFVVGCTARHSATLDRPIPQFSWPSRYESCDTLWILSTLHRAAAVSMGIERLADGCWKRDDNVDHLWWRRGPPTQISNETVRQILNRITAADPAYEWRELAGVVVVRPRTSWDRPHPILTQPIAPFEAQSSDFGPAFAAVNRAFRPRRGFWDEDRWLLADNDDRPLFHVSFFGGSMLDALNAIVRSRSDLIWTLDYCRPNVSLSSAMLDLASTGRQHVQHAQLRRSVASFHEHPCD